MSEVFSETNSLHVGEADSSQISDETQVAQERQAALELHAAYIAMIKNINWPTGAQPKPIAESDEQ